MRKKLYTPVIAALLVLGMPMSAMAYGGGNNWDNDRHGNDSHWSKRDKRNNDRYMRELMRACADMETRTEIENDTDIDLTNNNPQYSSTGDVSVYRNTTAGAAKSGSAVNDSLFELDASIDNSSATAAAMLGGVPAGSATIENTGSDSVNQVIGSGGNSTIDTTGPDSWNLICNGTNTRTNVENDTDLDVTNNNRQTATSGNVMVSRNTTGGTATSGSARNVGTFEVSANVSSGKTSGGSTSSKTYKPAATTTKSTIDTTGPDSVNVIQNGGSSYTKVENETDVKVTNNNTQTATSGNVTVSRNTTAGSATSGDATNVSTTSVSLKVSN